MCAVQVALVTHHSLEQSPLQRAPAGQSAHRQDGRGRKETSISWVSLRVDQRSCPPHDLLQRFLFPLLTPLCILFMVMNWSPAHRGPQSCESPSVTLLSGTLKHHLRCCHSNSHDVNWVFFHSDKKYKNGREQDRAEEPCDALLGGRNE